VSQDGADIVDCVMAVVVVRHCIQWDQGDVALRPTEVGHGRRHRVNGGMNQEDTRITHSYADLVLHFNVVCNLPLDE